MLKYTAQRILLGVPTVILVATILFLMVRLIPGDIVDVMFAEQGSAGSVEEMREQLGLNEPLLLQYGRYMGSLARGDLGRSLLNNKPVLTEIRSRAGVSFELAVLAIAIASAIAIPVGILAAVKQDTPADYLLRGYAFLFLSIPNFFLGTLIILYGSIVFGWIPPVTHVGFWEDPQRNLAQFFIPAIVLGSTLSASQMRMTRTMMLETLRQDYVRTARAKGLANRQVLVRHALRNALIPVVTIIGLQTAGVLGGTVIIETIFNLPGLGRLSIYAINHRDYPMIQGINFVFAVVIILMNISVDVSYAFLDPRIRYRYR